MNVACKCTVDVSSLICFRSLATIIIQFCQPKTGTVCVPFCQDSQQGIRYVHCMTDRVLLTHCTFCDIYIYMCVCVCVRLNNDLVTIHRQDINAGSLLIKPMRTIFLWISKFNKYHQKIFKMSSAKWQALCLGLNARSWLFPGYQLRVTETYNTHKFLRVLILGCLQAS